MATLATLILLSYTQLLETIIASFSFVPLKYPNGTTVIKWLPDANVEYGEWKHIVLIFVAILILILGLFYTILIFSWQWLLQCPRSKFFRWTRNQKLHSFIDTYHTPHTTKHHYWTGLLLLVRVIVYLISAFSLSIDPRITLLSTVVIMCCLLLYKTVLIIRPYRNVMESFVYFNIAIFAIFSLYTFNDSGYRNKNVLKILQTVAAYISVGTVSFLFLSVIIFHVYRYGSAEIYSFLGHCIKLQKMMPRDQTSHQDGLISSLNQLMDAIDSPRVRYNPPFLQRQNRPSGSGPALPLKIGDDPANSKSLHNQSEDKNSTKHLQDGQGNVSRTKPRAKSHNIIKSTSIMTTEFELSSRSEPVSFSFTSQHTSNESMKQPLLKEPV